MSAVSRRRFLSGGSALVSAPVISQLPLQLLGQRSALADGGATSAVVVAASSVASALLGLMHGSTGLGERLLAMQLTLNAILNNQIRTLEAISAVNDNLELLKKQLPE